MRCTVVIKPEVRKRIYWTNVSIDTFALVGGPLAAKSTGRRRWKTDTKVQWTLVRRAAHPTATECRQDGTAKENELSRLVDELPGLVWIALADGKIDFSNQRWCEYTGLGLDETCGPVMQKMKADSLADLVKMAMRLRLARATRA